MCAYYIFWNLFQSLNTSGEDSIAELNPRLLPGKWISIVIFKLNSLCSVSQSVGCGLASVFEIL